MEVQEYEEQLHRYQTQIRYSILSLYIFVISLVLLWLILVLWLSEDSVKSVTTKPIVHKIDSVRKGTIPVYEYQLLESATNKFSDSNVLSRGGRGCLYRACLDEKSSVTVKKLDGGGETDIEKQFEV